jgi:hypothetical protein
MVLRQLALKCPKERQYINYAESEDWFCRKGGDNLRNDKIETSPIWGGLVLLCGARLFTALSHRHPGGESGRSNGWDRL